MKYQKHSHTADKLRETISKDLKYNGKPLWFTPVNGKGDSLITTWYGGVQIREMFPTVTELLTEIPEDANIRR